MTEFKPEQTGPSTQEPPTVPTVQTVEAWSRKEVLQWIQGRKGAPLEDDDLDNFNKSRVNGIVFLGSSFKFFRKICGLSPGASLALKLLAEEVRNQDKPPKQTAGRKRKGDDETVAPESSNKSPKRMRQEQQQGEEDEDEEEEEDDDDEDDEDDDEEDDDDEDDEEEDDEEDEEEEDDEEDEEDDDDDSDIDDCKRQDSIRLVDEPKIAKKRRKRIEKMIKDLHEEHSNKHPNFLPPDFPLSGAVAMLSDPEYEHLLPFPMIHTVVPIRFPLDVKHCWRYMGREKFAELLEELRFVRGSPKYESLWVYGTSGYGKSHLLAALVCYLAALGERVIYLPSPRSSIRNPIRHLQTAMLFAWTDKATQDKIITLNTQEKIKVFLEKQGNFIFVIDQMNEFTEAEKENKEATTKLRTLIDALVSSRTTVFSTSANCQEYLNRQMIENNDRTMPVYGGFTLKEAEQWWKRHSQMDLGGHCKEDIEDLTGGIPLHLGECVINGKINLRPLARVGAQAAIFAVDTALKAKKDGNRDHWQLYCDYVKACFTHSPVPDEVLVRPELVDHRYFFKREDNTGGYTCGIVRNAVADEFLHINNISLTPAS